MTSDSTNSPENLETESNSAHPDVELISQLAELEEKVAKTTDIETDTAVDTENSNSIIPNGELTSVLNYLQANSAANVDADSEAKKTEESNSELTDLDSNELGLPEPKFNNNIQVQLKTEEERLLLILPTESQVPASEISWSEIWQQMRQRLNAGDRLRTPNTTVHLLAKDRLLDTRQLQELAETLNEVKLQLKSVATSRRQTAIAACTLGYSVEQVQLQPSFNADSQATTSKPQADALYLEMTVRSGGEIRHPGTVIILGDINPGGIVVADGDILVWGRLRGVAHAGAGGNRDCLIMALQMEPTQLRIADAVARAPEKSPSQFFAEVAHITPAGIRIAKATDFSRSQLSKINQNL
ncbi:septum site-determining protein MinC [Anabaena cylindrica FACHB-243]|uniref:Probable septum site-determining protein MinC n=1 Tax=Anabaena cylindrica (strain ATCC 27899 / PCC 7122) TaxID=272123 RepID=K9ZD26_ANACC|nr:MULTISPECIES: septum site-determining protein MinC [Anabaena]AFZ56512.1 septum site-determining protein MinC [Anabaena cylindrica PCC 7122]MBD2418548.1 septum site-determining protein MinC [Anabaena cylindrica FACHB-243]MBY5284181.1 septum site-determining protein MinC [Anabaena sp. CCAP 1446/1C]MBY5310870.1 septum site-determining protein MinC [Anabaena sp. CCAP 1446/1C]MCM2409938.1 septum site-determining protein MinC [Anabaena sp. CCAP 1446/1C]